MIAVDASPAFATFSIKKCYKSRIPELVAAPGVHASGQGYLCILLNVVGLKSKGPFIAQIFCVFNQLVGVKAPFSQGLDQAVPAHFFRIACVCTGERDHVEVGKGKGEFFFPAFGAFCLQHMAEIEYGSHIVALRHLGQANRMFQGLAIHVDMGIYGYLHSIGGGKIGQLLYCLYHQGIPFFLILLKGRGRYQ